MHQAGTIEKLDGAQWDGDHSTSEIWTVVTIFGSPVALEGHLDAGSDQVVTKHSTGGGHSRGLSVAPFHGCLAGGSRIKCGGCAEIGARSRTTRCKVGKRVPYLG